MRHRILTLLALLALTTFPLFADHQTAHKPVEALGWMAGTWQCSGDVFQTPMAPARKSVATVTTKWDLDGEWLAFSYVEKKTATAPSPAKFTGHMGYDAEKKQFVMVGFDNFGGYSTGMAAGMMNNSLVFTGPWHMGEMTSDSRDTFMKNADGSLSHMGEMMADGKWVKYAQETCRK